MDKSPVLSALVRVSEPAAAGDEHLRALEAEIKSYNEEIQNCSELESSYRTSLQQKAKEAAGEKDIVEKVLRWGKTVRALKLSDLEEIFRWRDSLGFPRTLIFGVESNQMFVSFVYVREIPSHLSRKRVEYCRPSNYGVRPYVLNNLLDCFNDIKDRWLAEGKARKLGFSQWLNTGGNDWDAFRRAIEFSANFNGVISPAMRSSIKLAREIFGDSRVHIIAEAPAWQSSWNGQAISTEFKGNEFLLVAVMGSQVLLLDDSRIYLHAPPTEPNKPALRS